MCPCHVNRTRNRLHVYSEHRIFVQGVFYPSITYKKANANYLIFLPSLTLARDTIIKTSIPKELYSHTKRVTIPSKTFNLKRLDLIRFERNYVWGLGLGAFIILHLLKF